MPNRCLKDKGKPSSSAYAVIVTALSIATSQRMTQAQWTGVVNDMVSRGAQGSQQDLDNVVSYLSTHFGQGAPPAASAMPAAAPAVAKENASQ